MGAVCTAVKRFALGIGILAIPPVAKSALDGWTTIARIQRTAGVDFSKTCINGGYIYGPSLILSSSALSIFDDTTFIPIKLELYANFGNKLSLFLTSLDCFIKY